MSISQLKNTKQGKACLIVSGGHSVNLIDLQAAERKGIDIVCVNYNLTTIRPAYYIHCDKILGRWYEYINTSVPVISYYPNICAKTRYTYLLGDTNTYTYDDGDHIMTCSHSTPYAVQICDLMGYDTIYLIGADYYGDTNKLHYYDSKGAWERYKDSRLFDMYKRFVSSIVDKNYFSRQKRMYDNRIFRTDNTVYSAINDYANLKISANRVKNLNKNSKLSIFEYVDIDIFEK